MTCLGIIFFMITLVLNQVVAVLDGTPPVVTGCPDSITLKVSPDEYWKTVTWVEPTATDETESLTTIQNHSPGNYFYIGSTIVSYYFIDGSQNIAECQFTITITSSAYPNFDATPPILTCPSEKEVFVSPATSSSRVTFEATARDNSGEAVSMFVYPPSGSRFSVGVTTVWASATDQNNNRAFCTFDVIVSVMSDVCFPNPCPEDKECYGNFADTAYRCDYNNSGVTTAGLPITTTELSRGQDGMCTSFFSTANIIAAIFGSIFGVVVVQVIIFAVYRGCKLNDLDTKIFKSKPSSPQTSHRYERDKPTTEASPARPESAPPNGASGTSNPAYDNGIGLSSYQGLEPMSRDRDHKYMDLGEKATDDGNENHGNEHIEDDDGYTSVTPNSDYMEVIP